MTARFIAADYPAGRILLRSGAVDVGAVFPPQGLPPLRATNRLAPPRPGTAEHRAWSAIHRAPPGPDRWKFRSKTFPGMAAAWAAQWGGDAADQFAS